MATGATVMTKTAWAQLEPRDQQIVLEEAKAMEAEVTKQVREDNTKAYEQLQKKNGLIEVPTPIEMQRDVAKRVLAIADKANAQFSKEFQIEVNKLLEEYRQKHPGELPPK
jgi:TRAP-type C4-dicarboxylate transport system substrate-binding protein